MRVIDKINKRIAEDRVCFSFEYFPPKTQEGVQNLYERLQRMVLLDPLWIDVTWGAGGTTSDLTLEICDASQNYVGLETMMHLTCTNMPRDMIDFALKKAKESGVQNILALRGDPPRGEEWKQIEGGFAHAADLVRYIKEQYGDFFGIAVAGYPEAHTDSTDKELDLKFLKEKVDAGADIIITQLFYDVDMFLEFYKNCRAIGIACPIIPGIMPIHTYGGFKRMTSLCKTAVPQYILDEIDPVKDNDEEVKRVGVNICINMCKKLIANNVNYLHFYTLNLEQSVTKILLGLQLISKDQIRRPLPWIQNGKRLKEEVRPIFWSNRPHSYIARTTEWDEFPNGRWGDHRSPAYGDLSDYHLYNQTMTKCLNAVDCYGEVTNAHELSKVFASFCTGDRKTTPFTDTPLALETDVIKEKLVQVNLNGFYTINSQPAVNGASSADEKFGWGPKGGYVYQKAYVEFFTSPANMQKILEVAKASDSVTFHAVNVKGESYSNTNGTNAVTWGVFPGKEIIQPTVVDGESFNVWKDEAFLLFKSRWATKYGEGTPSRSFLESVIDSYFLVSVVHNDYINGNIFELFDKASALTTNGVSER